MGLWGCAKNSIEKIAKKSEKISKKICTSVRNQNIRLADRPKVGIGLGTRL